MGKGAAQDSGTKDAGEDDIGSINFLANDLGESVFAGGSLSHGVITLFFRRIPAKFFCPPFGFLEPEEPFPGSGINRGGPVGPYPFDRAFAPGMGKQRVSIAAFISAPSVGYI